MKDEKWGNKHDCGKRWYSEIPHSGVKRKFRELAESDKEGKHVSWIRVGAFMRQSSSIYRIEGWISIKYACSKCWHFTTSL